MKTRECRNDNLAMRPPPPSTKLLVFLILGGAGLGLVAVGVVTPWGWRMFAPGLVAVVVSLVALWIIFSERDKTLR